MTEDRVYRIVLFVLLAGGLSASIAMGRRVEQRRGHIGRDEDGPVIAFGIRVGGLAFYGGMLAYLVYPPILGWAAVGLAPGVRWLGAGLVAGGAALAVWARRCLGDSSTVTSVPREDAELVTHGPYARMRHPVYSAGLLLIPGAAMLAANFFIFAAGLAVMAVVMVRTRREEALLIEKFGDAYLAYMERTGRLLPKLFGRPAA